MGCVTVNLKKILTWVGVAIALYFLANAPVAASDGVKGIFGGLQNAADSVILFVQNVFR